MIKAFHRIMISVSCRMRISGDLPSLNVSISDHIIKELTALALSIPLPESDAPSNDEIELDAPDISRLTSEGNADQLVKQIPGDESGYDSSTDEDEVIERLSTSILI